MHILKIMTFMILFHSWSVFASSENPLVISVKERLRIHLWNEGLEVKPVKEKSAAIAPQKLKEEIDIPLRKF